jgi:putative ABC transport system permease protein
MLGRRFTIVGVLEEKGSSMMGSEDDRIIIPLTTGQRVLRQRRPAQFYFSATTSDTVPQAQADIEDFFLGKLKSKDDYFVFNQSQVLSIVGTAMSTITGMLAGIAAISLLVGGIGIMNIMLVSVTERTREIGIRKAIGARRRNILTQFLIESSVISLGGGVIGLALAILIGRALQGIINLTLNFSLNTIILALAFSICVGIGFGMYPANKASKLNPIEALRYE